MYVDWYIAKSLARHCLSTWSTVSALSKAFDQGLYSPSCSWHKTSKPDLHWKTFVLLLWKMARQCKPKWVQVWMTKTISRAPALQWSLGIISLDGLSFFGDLNPCWSAKSRSILNLLDTLCIGFQWNGCHNEQADKVYLVCIAIRQKHAGASAVIRRSGSHVFGSMSELSAEYERLTKMASHLTLHDGLLLASPLLPQFSLFKSLEVSHYVELLDQGSLVQQDCFRASGVWPWPIPSQSSYCLRRLVFWSKITQLESQTKQK